MQEREEGRKLVQQMNYEDYKNERITAAVEWDKLKGYQKMNELLAERR